MDAQELNTYIVENPKDTIPKILEGVGCENVKVNSNYITASNPDGDNLGAITCYLNEDSVIIINWTRGYRGDTIGFVKSMKGWEFYPSYKWICKTLGLAYTRYKKEDEDKVLKGNPFERLKKFRMVKNFSKPLEPISESVLEKFTPIEWEGLFREGVTPKTCKEFGIRYSYDQKRIIYPHRNAIDGTLVAYNARTVIDNYEELGIPKFFISKGYIKTSNVYGLWENRKYMEEAGCCIVVESEKSVLKRHSLGDKRFCAVSGHSISEEQKRLLAALSVSEIVISFDNDVEIKEVLYACEKLYPYKKVSFTKDLKGIMGKKDSIADLRNKDCLQILEERRVYTEEIHKQFVKKYGRYA